jgi:adenylate cyclase
MFTDMVGYTALSQRNEPLALELLEEHRRILRSIFPRFNGTEIKTIGDAFLVEFQSALEAAQCALEIQRTLAKRNHDVLSEHRIELRIGIHVGDVVHREGDVYGDGVNVASRIQPVAGIGGICISVDVERQIHHALDARFEKLAPVELKNVEVPMDLFRIVLPWERNARLTAEPKKTQHSATTRAMPWHEVLLAVLLLIGLIGAGIFFLRHRASQQASNAIASPPPSSSVASVPEKSLAVLPFENLSEDKANEFFTNGVQDEILSHLAKVADLKVISRTSVMQYKTGAPRNLREIGQQLGVAHLVEGSVQRAANKVRVIAQLIDARNDAHLWAQTYDRDLADVFAVQSEIAKGIADQLQARLSPAEKNAIEQRPTADVTAFELYSRAKTLTLNITAIGGNLENDLRQAIELLRSAVARDPAFHAAFCELAWVHDRLYSQGYDHTADRLSAAEEALHKAATLRPDSPETHFARARHLYYALRDYKGAEAELEIAARGLPNDSRIPEIKGYIVRRKGAAEEGLRLLQQVLTMDPRNFNLLQQIAVSQLDLRRYAEAADSYDRSLQIQPNIMGGAGVLRTLVDFYGYGDAEPMCRFVEQVRVNTPASLPDVCDNWFWCGLAKKDWAAAEQALAALGGNPSWADGPIVLSRQFGEGLLARAMHDDDRARRAFVAARVAQEKIVQEQKDYGPPLCVLGLIDAALGNKEAALQEGRLAMELLPREKDALNSEIITAYFAVIAAWAGEKDLSLQQLSAAIPLSGAGTFTSYGVLKLMPFWDPLRGDPRFEKIVASLAPK